jgi:hypothetical protein
MLLLLLLRYHLPPSPSLTLCRRCPAAAQTSCAAAAARHPRQPADRVGDKRANVTQDAANAKNLNALCIHLVYPPVGPLALHMKHNAVSRLAACLNFHLLLLVWLLPLPAVS